MLHGRWLILAALCAPALAEAPRSLPPPPAPPSPPIYSNKPPLLNSPPSALNPRSSDSSNWNRLQDSLDRSTGRITDESLYQTERLQRLRDARIQPPQAQREFDRFQEERERRLRIEAQVRQRQLNEQQIQRELDRREYELFINSDLSNTASQAALDEQTLRDAMSKRDNQILAANDERIDALKQNAANSDQIESKFRQRSDAARAEYQVIRRRVLGFPEPATMPTTQP